MAFLENLTTGAVHPISGRHLVGRSRTCHLCISPAKVSNVHAEFVWDGRNWSLRDLGSRNGTFMGEHKLVAGDAAPLERGSVVMFGDKSLRFRLMDDSPPSLMAIDEQGNAVVADGDVLSLPSPESCEVTVLCGVDGVWQVERSDCIESVGDRPSIVVGKHIWRLCLPYVQARMTWDEPRPEQHTLADVELEFFVSRDGEHVSITLKQPGGSMPIESRAHAFLLLTLAECRLKDAAQGHLPESEHGWVHRDDLLCMLAIELRLLNLWVYRSRQQFSAIGIPGAAHVIERRPSAQQIRLGVPRVLVRKA